MQIQWIQFEDAYVGEKWFGMTIHGSRYFVSFVDDQTRLAWIYPIQSKSDVFDRFKQWLAMVENIHETKLRVLQTDKKLRTWMSADTGGSNTGLKVLQ